VRHNQTADGATEPERRCLRVAMTTARYLPGGGGTAIHVHEVAQRLVAAGVDVTVVTTVLERSEAGRTIEQGIPVVRTRAWPRGTDLYVAPALARVLRRERFDLVHCQGYHTFVAPISMLSALRSHVPYVVTFHSGGHSSSLRRAIRPLQVRLLRPLLRRAAALIAVSDFEADLFATQLGLSRSRLTVIPSGHELPIPTDAPPRPPEPLIVSIGRLEGYKGHHRVIEALPLVHRTRPDMRIRLVGTGPAESALKKLADALGVRDAVDIGPVAADQREQLAKLLQRAAVVAALSEYESQGLGAYEALALGRPLLVNDSSALSELAGRPGVHMVASTASPATVAAALLESIAAPPAPPALLPTWDDCVSAVLRVYDDVIAKRG
jgi:glycosyltransferase involved in cell wall biosynthesis